MDEQYNLEKKEHTGNYYFMLKSPLANQLAAARAFLPIPPTSTPVLRRIWTKHSSLANEDTAEFLQCAADMFLFELFVRAKKNIATIRNIHQQLRFLVIKNYSKKYYENSQLFLFEDCS